MKRSEKEGGGDKGKEKRDGGMRNVRRKREKGAGVKRELRRWRRNKEGVNSYREERGEYRKLCKDNKEKERERERG